MNPLLYVACESRGRKLIIVEVSRNKLAGDFGGGCTPAHHNGGSQWRVTGVGIVYRPGAGSCSLYARCNSI